MKSFNPKCFDWYKYNKKICKKVQEKIAEYTKRFEVKHLDSTSFSIEFSYYGKKINVEIFPEYNLFSERFGFDIDVTMEKIVNEHPIGRALAKDPYNPSILSARYSEENIKRQNLFQYPVSPCDLLLFIEKIIKCEDLEKII